MPENHLTPETIEKMKYYRDIGKSVKYIMSACHVSEKSVIRYTKKKSWKLKSINEHYQNNSQQTTCK